MLDPKQWQQLRIKRETADRLTQLAARVSKAHRAAGGGTRLASGAPSYDAIIEHLLDQAERDTARARRYRHKKKCSTDLEGPRAAG